MIPASENALLLTLSRFEAESHLLISSERQTFRGHFWCLVNGAVIDADWTSSINRWSCWCDESALNKATALVLWSPEVSHGGLLVFWFCSTSCAGLSFSCKQPLWFFFFYFQIVPLCGGKEDDGFRVVSAWSRHASTERESVSLLHQRRSFPSRKD